MLAADGELRVNKATCNGPHDSMILAKQLHATVIDRMLGTSAIGPWHMEIQVDICGNCLFFCFVSVNCKKVSNIKIIVCYKNFGIQADFGKILGSLTQYFEPSLAKSGLLAGLERKSSRDWLYLSYFKMTQYMSYSASKAVVYWEIYCH
jgi:hypothetical protein